MLRTLRKCTWDEIEVGEVFAYSGCVTISYKINTIQHIPIANNENSWEHICRGGEFDGTGLSKLCKIYKLPLSVQRLWKT